MARPQRNNVDYFPYYCDEGNKMFYLEETYGNDGFATFLKILRELAKTDYHYLDLSKNTTKMFLSAKCKVSKEVLESIINDLVDLEKFDADLWSKESIIYCQDFIDSIQDAYAKRSNDCISKKSLLELLISKGRIKQSKSNPKPSKLQSDSPVNPQRKEKDSKEKDIILKKDATAFSFTKSFIDLGVDEQILKDWLKVRRKKKATDSETSFKSLKSQIELSGKSANECIRICVESDWKGFKSEWLTNKQSAFKSNEKYPIPLKTPKFNEIEDEM